MVLSFTHSSSLKVVKFCTPIPNSFTSLPTTIPTPFLPSLASKSASIPVKFSLSDARILTKASPFTISETTNFDVEDLGGDDEDLAASPWEGAVVYRRNASVSHVESCTTLERLGLGKLSSSVSRSRAATMGIRLPVRRGKDSAFGDEESPVLVSLDITRRKRRLKLDGIVRTVITLPCNRCGEPAAECVFSNFNLLLTEDPIEDPDEIELSIKTGQDRDKRSSIGAKVEDDEEEIDIDDRLHFPSEEKEIDISKHIRDIIHVEITINAICDAGCIGICLRCGTNLNRSSCKCSKDVAEGTSGTSKEYGPLKGLRMQMQKS